MKWVVVILLIILICCLLYNQKECFQAMTMHYNGNCNDEKLKDKTDMFVQLRKKYKKQDNVTWKKIRDDKAFDCAYVEAINDDVTKKRFFRKFEELDDFYNVMFRD